MHVQNGYIFLKYVNILFVDVLLGYGPNIFPLFNSELETFLTIFTIVFNKLYTYLSILLLILLPIPVSYHLLDDILDLKNHYDRVVESLNNRVNNTIVFTSPLILNNIIVSRDMKYIFE